MKDFLDSEYAPALCLLAIIVAAVACGATCGTIKSVTDVIESRDANRREMVRTCLRYHAIAQCKELAR